MQFSSLKDISFTELIQQVFHARTNEVIKKYMDKHFGRHSKKGERRHHVQGIFTCTDKKSSTEEMSFFVDMKFYIFNLL